MCFTYMIPLPLGLPQVRHWKGDLQQVLAAPALSPLPVSLEHFVFLFDVLSFVLFLFVWFFPCVYLPLDFWSTPSYDLVLKADRHTHDGYIHTRNLSEEERLVQRRMGYEWAEERFWAELLFKTSGHLLPEVICDNGTTASLQPPSFAAFTGASCHICLTLQLLTYRCECLF